MTCREATDFLTDYLAGDLPATLRAEFERHLSRCPNCEIFLEQFRETIAAGQRAFADPCAPADIGMPEDLVQAIVSAVKKADA